MKKLLLLISIIAVIALTGCYNKTVQQEQPLGLNATSTGQATTTKTQIDTYGDAKVFGSKTLGWEIKFTEPYQKIDCSDCIGGMYLLFGPMKKLEPPEGTGDLIHLYSLTFTEAKSLNNEFEIIKTNALMPETVAKKKIGAYDVITWNAGGYTDTPMMEVIGSKYNLIMSTDFGPLSTEQEDFKYFEGVINGLKSIN